MEVTLTDDFKKLRSSVRELVINTLDPISLEVEKSSLIPEYVVDELRHLGLFGMPIPKTYGGLGLTTIEEILIYEELTRTNGSYRSRIGTSNGIGSMGIVYDGTAAQKSHYLPRIASGEWTSAFALTEPDAGSDAGNIRTTAVLEGDHWVLNGNKIFITNADTAQLFTTIVVTDEEKRNRGGVTAFIVEKGVPGFSIGATDIKMGLKGSHTHELVFKDCRVPKDNVIGGMDMVGQGFKTAMRVLDKGRLTMGACAVGAAQRVMELTIEHIHRKLASGTSKGDLQTAQFLLADMATRIYAARQMLHHTARMKDSGDNVTRQSSMVKVFCTETASLVADWAMDIFEEDGCLTGNQVEMFLRDVRLYRIYEGTSEIQRLIISRDLLSQ
ncbi:MAG: acyl-CoA dehydrogenase [Desulfobacteraceae bacterium]|nr:acyl-CoA dehydrogenase [Desulfobacteraceae bacterium]